MRPFYGAIGARATAFVVDWVVILIVVIAVSFLIAQLAPAQGGNTALGILWLIGLFVILGFAMRWTILISLAFITLSILYFQELLWPHFILYGISFSLLINSGDLFTLDHWIVPWLKKVVRRA